MIKKFELPFFSCEWENPQYFHLFFSSNNANTTIWVNWFGLPLLQTRITQAQKETFITLSDHEPVISTINLKKWKWFYLIFWPVILFDIIKWYYCLPSILEFHFSRTIIKTRFCQSIFYLHLHDIKSSY